MAPSVHQGWDPDRLRRRRERHGLTLDQVADAMRNLAVDGFCPPNATFQTVGRHERGESYPRPRYQRAYCELYGVNEVALGFRAPLPGETLVPGQAAPVPVAAPVQMAAPVPVAARQHRRRTRVTEPAGLTPHAAASGRVCYLGDEAPAVRPVRITLPMGAQEAAALAIDRLRRGSGDAAKTADAPLADALAVILAAQREVEDVIGSAPLLDPVTAQLRNLMPLVVAARGPARSRLVDIVAQWAQFAGWLHANTGETAQAGVWLDRASEWAAEAGNSSLTANILSYKGHLAWEARAVGPLIGLSQAAQRVPDVYPGQRAYDADQEARGYAMAGDAEATDRKLGVARELWQRACDHDEGPPPWSYYFSPSFARLQEGLAQRYLAAHDPRRARRAVEALGAGLGGLPEEQRGAEWAAEFVYHLAIAHLHNGEPEQACEVTLTAAAIAEATGSRRVTTQVRALQDRIARGWPTLPAVTALNERLRGIERPAH